MSILEEGTGQLVGWHDPDENRQWVRENKSRELRDKRMTTSVLDDIDGLGPSRKKRLLKELGGVKAVRAASLDELRALTWLPDAVADNLYAKLHAPSSSRDPRTQRAARALPSARPRPPVPPPAPNEGD